MLLGLAQDDPLNVRLVVDEALTEAEAASWVARARAVLRLPTDQLVISGGFDPRGGDPRTDEFCQIRTIAPGRYQVDVYTFAAGSASGHWALERALGEESLGEFARRTSQGPLPRWVVESLAEPTSVNAGTSILASFVDDAEDSALRAAFAQFAPPEGDLVDELATVDAALASEGLEPIGELVAEAVGNICMRAWLLAGGRGYFVAYRGRPFEGWEGLDVVADFGDGLHATVANTPSFEAPKAGLFRKIVPTSDPVELLKAALPIIAELEDDHGPVVTRTPDLPALCALVDSVIAKQQGHSS